MSVVAFITSTYMVETISISCAIRAKERIGTLFPEESYDNKQKYQQLVNEKDGEHKESPFYVREKIELGILA